MTDYTTRRYVELDRAQDRLEAERRFATNPNRCPYCGTRYDDLSGGWFRIYPDFDPIENPRPDKIEPTDIHVAEWDGWYRLCIMCNEDGERWPTGLTVATAEKTTCSDCGHGWGAHEHMIDGGGSLIFSTIGPCLECDCQGLTYNPVAEVQTA